MKKVAKWIITILGIVLMLLCFSYSADIAHAIAPNSRGVMMICRFCGIAIGVTVAALAGELSERLFKDK